MLYENDFTSGLRDLEGILKNWRPGNGLQANAFLDFNLAVQQQISLHWEKANPENLNQFLDTPIVGPVQTREQIQTWEELGDTRLRQGRFPEALAAFSRAMELDEKVADATKLAELKFKTSKIFAEFGRWELARHLLNECQSYFEKTENHFFLTQIRIEKARTSIKNGQYPVAKKLLEKALNTAEHMHNFNLIHAVCLQTGILFQILDSSKFVLAYFEEALRVAQKALDPRSIADTYFHLGVFYQTRQEEEKASTYYEISKRLCEDHDFLLPRGFIYLQEAVIARDLLLALDSLKNALQIFIETENQPGLAKCIQILGRWASQSEDWEVASKFFELAIEIFQNFGLPYDLALSCVQYADQLLEREQINDATRHYEMASNLFRELRLEDLYLKLEEELTVLSRFSLDYSEALPR